MKDNLKIWWKVCGAFVNQFEDPHSFKKLAQAFCTRETIILTVSENNQVKFSNEYSFRGFFLEELYRGGRHL